jgi:hypothetical protein
MVVRDLPQSSVNSATRPENLQFSLDMSPELDTRIDEIAHQMGRSKSDVVSTALALLDVVAQAKEQFGDVEVLLKSSQETTRLVGIF